MKKKKHEEILTNADKIACLKQEWQKLQDSLDHQPEMHGEDDRRWSQIWIEAELVQLQIDEEVRKALEEKRTTHDN